MAQQMQALAVIIVLAALAYVLYLWSKRRDTVECPSCGGRVNIYDEECPHCGYERGGPLDDGATDADEAAAASTGGAAQEEPDADTTTAQDEVVCDDCGETFDSEQGLNIHRGMKH